MAPPALRVAIVGAGNIAQAYGEVFARTSPAHVVAVADQVPERAAAMAARFGCRSFGSHQAMLAEVCVDAAVVCTPPASHAEVTIDLLEASVPVLCEKPLTISSVNARRMLAAASANSATIMMAAKFRYVDDVARAIALVKEGIIGDVVLFENAFTAKVSMGDRWNCRPAVSGGGVLVDNGTHSVDLVRCFLGPISEVLAVEGPRLQGLEVEDTAHLFLRGGDGALANVDLSWSVDKGLDSYAEICGTGGTMRLGWSTSSYRTSRRGEWRVFGSGYDKLAAMGRQVDDFLATVAGRRSPRITGEDALASVEVIEAAYASLARKAWVAVPAAGDIVGFVGGSIEVEGVA
jgi:predicted dehydrogenase